jgi:DNA-binding PadR family transcriptional regulator
MRESSTPGFDLRSAIDNLRATFDPAPTAGGNSEGTRRGDIRTAILIELGDEPMHGYQIISAVEERSGGAWKPTPGSVYPTLQLLVDEQLVASAQVGERKVYSLTEAGHRAAAEAAAAAATEPGRPSGQQQRGQGIQSAMALGKSGVRLAQALTQVAQNGSPEQSERAQAIIDEARRKLYAILAED